MLQVQKPLKVQELCLPPEVPERALYCAFCLEFRSRTTFVAEEVRAPGFGFEAWVMGLSPSASGGPEVFTEVGGGSTPNISTIWARSVRPMAFHLVSPGNASLDRQSQDMSRLLEPIVFSCFMMFPPVS